MRSEYWISQMTCLGRRLGCADQQHKKTWPHDHTRFECCRQNPIPTDTKYFQHFAQVKDKMPLYRWSSWHESSDNIKNEAMSTNRSGQNELTEHQDLSFLQASIMKYISINERKSTVIDKTPLISSRVVSHLFISLSLSAILPTRFLLCKKTRNWKLQDWLTWEALDAVECIVKIFIGDSSAEQFLWLWNYEALSVDEVELSHKVSIIQ